MENLSLPVNKNDHWDTWGADHASQYSVVRGMFSRGSTHKIRLEYRLSSSGLKRLTPGRAPVLAGVLVMTQLFCPLSSATARPTGLAVAEVLRTEQSESQPGQRQVLELVLTCDALIPRN